MSGDTCSARHNFPTDSAWDGSRPQLFFPVVSTNGAACSVDASPKHQKKISSRENARGVVRACACSCVCSCVCVLS